MSQQKTQVGVYKSKYSDDIDRILKKIDSIKFSFDEREATDRAQRELNTAQLNEKTYRAAKTMGIDSSYSKAAMSPQSEEILKRVEELRQDKLSEVERERRALERQAKLLLSLDKEAYRQYYKASTPQFEALKKLIASGLAGDSATTGLGAALSALTKTTSSPSGKTVVVK